MRPLLTLSRVTDVQSRARYACAAWLLCIVGELANQSHAQEAASPPEVPPPVPGAPITHPPVTTLDRVQALRPEEEVLDLYTFKNPIAVDPNRFDKAYDPGITPEEMALDPHYGGYVIYGINMGLLKTWQGIKKVTGMRPYEQPAIARPSPLTEEQMRRAVRGPETGE